MGRAARGRPRSGARGGSGAGAQRAVLRGAAHGAPLTGADGIRPQLRGLSADRGRCAPGRGRRGDAPTGKRRGCVDSWCASWVPLSPWGPRGAHACADRRVGAMSSPGAPHCGGGLPPSKLGLVAGTHDLRRPSHTSLVGLPRRGTPAGMTQRDRPRQISLCTPRCWGSVRSPGIHGMQMNPMLSRIMRPQTCTSALSEVENGGIWYQNV